MIDSIYHMTLKLLKNRIFGVKTSRFSHLFSGIALNKGLLPLCDDIYDKQL